MLKFLRKKENLKKIMWTLAILIIPAFALWGSGSAIRSRRFPKYAGKIFGKKVSFRQYEASLLACRNQALIIYGENLNNVAQYLDLEEEAWERLILLYQAKQEKIKVSDEVLVKFIEKLPLFQKQGHFAQDRYNTLLDYAFRTSPREFEEQIREILKMGKLRDKVIAKVSLTDEEIENGYKKENEKAKVLYILIEPQKFEDQIHPSYEELQNYYQDHKTEFKKPEQVNVQYIALYFEQNRPEVDINEEEIKSFYQEHPDEFSIKDKKGKESIKPLEEVKAQIEQELSKNKARVFWENKAWQISDETLEDGASFEEVAKKHQLEVKETGFFGPQQVIQEIGLSYEFLNTAFSLKIGEVSNVLETPKGYFIIKVIEKKQPYIPPLDEIKEKVETYVILQESRGLAKNKGEEILAQIKNIMQEERLNFEKTAEKLTLAVKETEEFKRASYVSGIGQNVAEFTQGAFELKPGEVSDLISVPNGYCILSLKNIFPIDQEKFAQEQEEFAKRLLARKKDFFYKIWLANLKKKAKLVSNIGDLNSALRKSKANSRR